MYNFVIEDFEKIDLRNYLQRTVDSHIFHSIEWMKTIKETLGLSYKIAMLKDNGKVIASIPFLTYRNFIKGPSALPLHLSGYYDTIVSDNDKFKNIFLNKFFEHCLNHKLYTQIPEINAINGYKNFFGYSIYKMKIEGNSPAEEQIIARAYIKRSKEMTKNSDKCDLLCNTGSLELLDKFYFLYLQNMKELGTPPFPKNYFRKIIENFPQKAKIILVENQRQICSSSFIIKVSKKELFTYVISTPRLYKSGRSSHLIYMQAAKEAQNLGCSVINFGRSIDGSGPAFFKSRYGLEIVPLLIYSPYENWNVTNPKNSILRHAVTIWKKLPIPLTRVGGILFAKHVI